MRENRHIRQSKCQSNSAAKFALWPLISFMSDAPFKASVMYLMHIIFNSMLVRYLNFFFYNLSLNWIY